MTTPATHKIAIVAGQRFGPIPADTSNEVIREQLKAMGFADVASAEIKTGREGEAETVEFVKKAGTKGLGGEGLAAALARTPRAQGPGGNPLAGSTVLSPTEASLLWRLTIGDLTLAEALNPALPGAINTALRAAPSAYSQTPQSRKERELCERLDTLPAVAGPAPSGW